MTPAQTLRHQLREAGYSPIPLFGKEPPVYGKNNKHGGLTNWQNLTDVTAEMIEMWTKQWPDAENTGCLTRNMPTCDLDLESPDAVRDCVNHILEHYEEIGHVLVRTGKAPRCAILFRTIEPFAKFTANLIAPNGKPEKIEFLADGEQVVVDGIHPETKQSYRWHGGEPGLIKLENLPYIREAEARALIDRLVEILVRDHGYKLASARPREPNGAKPGAGGEDDWKYLFENIRRGAELHDSICMLAAKMIKAGMQSGAVINSLRGLMEGSEVSHDERWEARHRDISRAVDSAMRKYRADPEPPPTDDEPPPQPPPKPGRFALRLFSLIRITAVLNYFVKGILPGGGLAVVWGQPKCGKSFWVFDLVMHIALGRKYRGHKVRQGTVVYLALEGGSRFANRIEAWRQRYQPDESAQFYLLDVPVNLIADCRELITAIRTQVKKPDVVVVDTLNRALAGDENNPEDMGKFLHACDLIRTAFDCLILIIHHCGVANNRPRGHTSLSGADDVQIAIERDKDGVITATVEHMKDDEAGAVIGSKLERVELGNDSDGDSITSCVIVETEVPLPGPKLPKTLQFAFDTLQKILASKDDSVTVLAGSELAAKGIPIGTRVCKSEAWRQRFCDAYPGGEKPDSKRRTLARAQIDLMGRKLIELTGEYAWLLPPPDKLDNS